jgi:predicted nucleic-acid-binding Zn-ribbon protein
MQLLENKALSCPVCQSNKAEIAGENVKLSGQYENKEFLTTALIVLRCIKCGYYMFFDNTAKFTTEEKLPEN